MFGPWVAQGDELLRRSDRRRAWKPGAARHRRGARPGRPRDRARPGRRRQGDRRRPGGARRREAEGRRRLPGRQGKGDAAVAHATADANKAITDAQAVADASNAAQEKAHAAERFGASIVKADVLSLDPAQLPSPPGAPPGSVKPGAVANAGWR